MKYVIVAPVGDDIDALFVGIREFPTKRVVLVTPEDKLDVAKKAKEDLERFQIPAHITHIKGHLWEEMFKKIGEIRALETDSEIIVNTATGDKQSTCAATSAAFVNGMKAISVTDGQPMLLPVLKFSYYNILTEKKMQILKLLAQPDCCTSLEQLSKKTKMSLPLISYHINGNLKSEGLKEMGLVEAKENKGKIALSLSTLGKMLVHGYVDAAPSTKS